MSEVRVSNLAVQYAHDQTPDLFNQQWIHHIQSTDCQDVAHTKRYPPFCGPVTEKETEGPVFTLAEWAACEPHGNGQLTSDGEKAPPWLTGPGFWSSAQSVQSVSLCASLPRGGHTKQNK